MAHSRSRCACAGCCLKEGAGGGAWGGGVRRRRCRWPAVPLRSGAAIAPPADAVPCCCADSKRAPAEQRWREARRRERATTHAARGRYRGQPRAPGQLAAAAATAASHKMQAQQRQGCCWLAAHRCWGGHIGARDASSRRALLQLCGGRLIAVSRWVRNCSVERFCCRRRAVIQQRRDREKGRRRHAGGAAAH